MTDILRPFKSEHSNRHCVDRLGLLRAHVKSATALEKDLKNEVCALMGEADSLGGDEFIAQQRLQERKGGLDEKAIAKALGVDNLDAYRKPSTTSLVLDVKQRVEEEA
ncbi:hypothetical protein L1787_12960 [Acuticoccus sp. M5D2P5]|uniref:hypothetical protein n=1 Tax=Acuticoccus kalidii TaxID=2910977 RepID=UPI001F20215F|nr:hypothetical protein [Acuticoccus kalidii]MCF3934319.1 hypothetical protein [Acuticoccus kalidii]